MKKVQMIHLYESAIKNVKHIIHHYYYFLIYHFNYLNIF